MIVFLRSLFSVLLTLPVISAATSAHAKPEFTLKIATQAPEGTPWQELMDKYKAAVEKGTNGRMQVIVFYGGKSGNENDTISKTSTGHLQGVAASTGAMASVVPELSALELPFLFNGFGEADYVLDQVLTPAMAPLFRDRGLVFGFWSENGFRHFAGNFGKVTGPESLKGKKMRSQENRVHAWMWEALEAAAQPVPTTEVLTALETGKVIGYDQTLLFAIAAKWYKKVTDVTLSAHIYQPAAVAFNRTWFDGLPADIQKVLLDEGKAITEPGRKLIRAMNGPLVKLIGKDLKEDGKTPKVVVHNFDKAERKAFIAAFKPIADKVRAQFVAEATKSAAGGKDKSLEILKLIDAGLKTFRK